MDGLLIMTPLLFGAIYQYHADNSFDSDLCMLKRMIWKDGKQYMEFELINIPTTDMHMTNETFGQNATVLIEARYDKVREFLVING
jgi:hypothetical protein